jgi:hypothetical protein
LCVKAVLLVIKPDSSLGYVGCYVANFFCHVYAVYLRVLRPEEVSSRGFVGHVRREDRLTFQVEFVKNCNDDKNYLQISEKLSNFAEAIRKGLRL